MSDQTPFDQRKCQPCEGIGNPYNLQEANDRLSNIPGWKLQDDGKVIFKNYITKDFMAAVHFISRVAKAAETENHHPDIHLTSYRNLKIDLSTHAIGGLSENDFILAAKINNLPVELKKG